MELVAHLGRTGCRDWRGIALELHAGRLPAKLTEMQKPPGFAFLLSHKVLVVDPEDAIAQQFLKMPHQSTESRVVSTRMQ